MIGSAPSALDKFLLPELAITSVGQLSFQNTNGRTARTNGLVSGQNTGIFITAGQSNIANTVATTYTPTNGSVIDNFNAFDGSMYAYADPTLGTDDSRGTFMGRLADAWINDATYDRVIVVPVAVGQTSIAQWQSLLFRRVIIASQRLALAGMTADAVIWMQGEQDKNDGTTQSVYQAALSSVIAAHRTAGFSCPWFIGLCTYTGGTTSTAVRAAQSAVVNGTDIFAGADSDTLTGTAVNRQAADDTHMTAAGATSLAALWKTAIDAVL